MIKCASRANVKAHASVYLSVKCVLSETTRQITENCGKAAPGTILLNHLSFCYCCFAFFKIFTIFNIVINFPQHGTKNIKRQLLPQIAPEIFQTFLDFFISVTLTAVLVWDF